MFFFLLEITNHSWVPLDKGGQVAPCARTSSSSECLEWNWICFKKLNCVLSARVIPVHSPLLPESPCHKDVWNSFPMNMQVLSRPDYFCLNFILNTWLQVRLHFQSSDWRPGISSSHHLLCKRGSQSSALQKPCFKKPQACSTACLSGAGEAETGASLRPTF